MINRNVLNIAFYSKLSFLRGM